MQKFKVGDKVSPTSLARTQMGINDEWDNSIVFEPESMFGSVHVTNSQGVDGAFSPWEIELVEEKPMTKQVPFTISGDLITVFIGGTTHFVYSNEKNFNDLKEHLKGVHDVEVISRMVDKAAEVKRVTEGLVTVEGNQVLYDGVSVHNTLAAKLVELVDEGFDVKPWARFMDNLMQNPSYKSRESLYNFLDKWNAPITEDGCFVALKNVRQDFKDIHSGTFDNSPGKVVAMPRSQVNDDSNVHCSSGLHACATPYLDSFYSSGSRTVAVKINPRDVVSVPTDYNFAKLRCCQYEVIEEVTRQQAESITSSPTYTPFSEYDDYFTEENEDYYDSYYESY